MRAGVIGLLPTINDVLNISARQASLTHDTPIGIASAQAAALMVHHQAYGLGAPADLPDFLSQWITGFDWAARHSGPPFSGGDTMVKVAMEGLMQAQSLEELLIYCVDRGGDTDTVATIAMAAAVVSPNIHPILPNSLYDGLEAGPYGQPFLKHLDAHISAKFKVPALSRKPELWG